MSNKSVFSLLAISAACVLAMSTPFAQTSTTPSSTPPSTPTVEDTSNTPMSSTRLVASYTSLAGSATNASALVRGMQTGSSVTLSSGTASGSPEASTTFTPATSKLGLGEVNVALSLAKAELTKAGISNPTPAQLQAALNGGSITAADGSTLAMSGVLAQRSAGMGWGQIANTMGVKMGALVSASKSAQAAKKDAAVVSENAKAIKGDKDSAGNSSAKSGGSNAGGNGGGNGGGGGGGGGKK